MNKKLLLFIIAIIIAIMYLFSFEKTIYQELLKVNSKVQKVYLNTFLYIHQAVNKYFNQLDYIEQLKEQNRLSTQYKLLYEQKSNDYNQLVSYLEIQKSSKLDFEEVKVISYYQMSDYSKVIIDYKPELTNEKIKALITYDGYSAGIVVYKNGQHIGYLNQNKKSNYTVYIGKDNAPGITAGTNAQGRLIIKYVPIWKEVKLGDEVITSSMDSIFPYGIKVGKVEKINKDENIQEIIVRPYANTVGSRDFYLYDKKKEVQKEEKASN